MSKTISILGSTGSIGRQTLDVAEDLGLTVAALTANDNVELAEEQARKFRPRLVILTDEAAARDLKVRLADTGIKVQGGAAALSTAATLPGVDTVVTAVVGMVGLKPTLAAIREGKRIALANKETLVCAGELVMEAADRCGAEIVPVDSEHSAIFQCVQGCTDRGEIRQLILTCSGGPFYGLSKPEVDRKTRADALRHPNWKMGPKITVDCATLMNKGLEVIEAMRLYRLPLTRVKVVIHRQSIVHSLVEFRDGALLAQLGTPDMRLPIRYAMTWPRRAESAAEPLDLLHCPPLTFAEPDRGTFPCLRLAEVAAAKGGTACAVLNAANEEAVRLFLEERIGFREIFDLTAQAMTELPVAHKPGLADILEADAAAREAVRKHFSR
ncbi:1-deoxy-D-xylulose-5-phosphate reductoisomerase [uncultured Oscillibacter sp.]|uniref:1-deoxy-D-xylulose-5-phosphate reductoisomerase n=1 Tax=uncultured Oscillibacter sp. TaxID=876091 RepID=UPI0025E52534|nr:1-deoxy-D-xylulose-5-phosphate reductoisomerase [uncultured Oscillibacter sp.]